MKTQAISRGQAETWFANQTAIVRTDIMERVKDKTGHYATDKQYNRSSVRMAMIRAVMRGEIIISPPDDLKVMRLLNEVREGEQTIVTIFGQRMDYDITHPTVQNVSVNAEWTGYTNVFFTADSLLAALEKAAECKREKSTSRE